MDRTSLRVTAVVLLSAALTSGQKVTAPSGLPLPGRSEQKAGDIRPVAPQRKIVLVRGKKGAQPVAAEDPAIVQELEKAAALAATQHLEDAIAAYSAILERQPSSVTAWRERGRMHTKVGKWDDAIADLGRSLELNPQQPEAWLLRCAAGMESTDPREAGKDCIRAAELNPADAPAIEARAAAYAAVREFVRAADAFENSIERKADFPDAFVKARGAVTAAVTRSSAAVSRLQTLVSEYSGSTYPDKSHLLDRLSQFAEAIRTYQNILAKSRSNPARTRMLISGMGRHEQAWLLSEGGRAAQEIASAVPSLKPFRREDESMVAASSTTARRSRAGSALPSTEQGVASIKGVVPPLPTTPVATSVPQVPEANRPELPSAAAEPPTAPELRPAPKPAETIVAVAKAESVAPAAAVPQPQQTISTGPPRAAALHSDEQLRRTLEEASMYSTARQPEKAILAYNKALQIREDLPITWRDRARLKLELGDVPGAISDLSASLRHQPDQPALWRELCGLRLKDADPRLALPDCTRAVVAAPASPEARFALGRAHSASRKFVDAAEQLQAALESQPDFPDAHLELSRTYLELEEYVLALHHATKAIQQRPGFADAYKIRASAKEVLGDRVGHDEDIARAVAP